MLIGPDMSRYYHVLSSVGKNYVYSQDDHVKLANSTMEFQGQSIIKLVDRAREANRNGKYDKYDPLCCIMLVMLSIRHTWGVNEHGVAFMCEFRPCEMKTLKEMAVASADVAKVTIIFLPNSNKIGFAGTGGKQWDHNIT